MKAKISRVLLWPKRSDAKPPFREVPFNMKGIEVVTGGSQRGKSALIPIIDYCLGSEHCRDRVRFAMGWHLGITLGVCMSGFEPGQQSPSHLLGLETV
jgi:hypothetical protein